MKKYIGSVIALALVAGGLFAAVGMASTHATTAKVVTVTMTDYHFKLSRGPYKHGVKITFKVINKGNAIHNFDIQGKAHSKLITHGKTTTFTYTFKKAGKYTYLCDVPRHAELGMGGVLKVS
jgi:plastocyanin